MDVSALQLFVEVMNQGSFAAVARDRNLDPSSVSRAIAGLEAELGVRLFQRTTRQLSPTEAGTTYFERIEPLLAEMQQAIDIITDVSRKPRGTLRVTASVSFGHHCIVPLLPALAAQYPDLTVDLWLTDTVVDLVADRIDVAVRLGVLADSTLVAQRLMPTQYAVCASPVYLKRSHSLQQSMDLANHNCLLFPLAGFRSRWLLKDQTGQVSEVSVSGRTVISSAIALQQCAIAGMGLALLPKWLVDVDVQAGTLINVFPDYEVTATNFSTAAWLVYPSRAYMPLKVRAFINFLKQSVSG
ncbi:LysR family transcriptional regulator [Nodosilinea sp. E11]|uniref:LysR family transcriptional regulator n=1 Tax=Nodosilinea sp. E11 TaxID=3037479 RepID=UPI0029341A7D|nr:LysR family transcriptional regulator [Nodosilinea sp. E11]WOD36967.1 LysR family transcriptional regulator [Nodosilinea sp. E11]